MGAEMSDALRKAFEIAGRLPKREQDELAAAILEELASDKCWDAALGQSQEALSSGSGFAHTLSTIDFCEVSDALDGSLASDPAVKIVVPDDPFRSSRKETDG